MTEVKKKENPRKFKFTEEHAKTMLDLGQQGASQKMMFATIGISSNTAARLKKEDPFFAETLDMAIVHAQSYWESMMLANVDNKNFNSRLVEIALRGQFQDTYRERLDLKADVKNEVKIDFGKEVSELITALKKAK
jgi:hypothetical protein